MDKITFNMDDNPDLEVLFQEVHYPFYLGDDTIDFIKKLLCVNDKQRLGSGPSGFADLKSHPVFKG
jgi:3-phosphoinositide dependent protein kinase-1